MSNFYGNVTPASSDILEFDKIYPNRVTLEESAENDNIAIGRYVLIEYDIDLGFEANLAKDEEKYGNNPQFKDTVGYDSTAWLKIFADKKEKYIKIADLNTGSDSEGIIWGEFKKEEN